MLEGACEHRADPLAELIARERAQRLWEAIARLKALDREALLAFYIHGQSLVEIADPPDGYAPLIESLDTDRLRSLGWRAQVPLEEGIRSTLDWLLEAA